MTVRKEDAWALLMPRLTADADLACSRWPWTIHPRATREYRSKWHRRDWQAWLESRIETPFEALVMTPDRRVVCQIDELLPSSAEQARHRGIYFAARHNDEAMILGATAVNPVDQKSANAAALCEYSAYREQAGPPPGVRNEPSVRRLK